MRILIVAPRLPWPPLDGGRVAMSRLAESLARGAVVEVLSLNPRKHRGTPGGPLPIRAIDIETSRLAGPLLRSLVSEPPFIVTRFISAEFREALRETLARFRPDIVQIESPLMLPYAREVRGAKVVLRSLNVEFRIWEGLARVEKNAVRRFLLGRVAASLRRYEVRAMQRIDAVVPITAADAADFRALGVKTAMHVVPCGVAMTRRADEGVRPSSVGFIGALDYMPNQDAVRWILEELWPRVIREEPEARLNIAGSSPPEWLKPHVLANIPDAGAFIKEQSVLIAPLFAGGGMRIKVLEAMAAGKAIVATTLGAGGIEVETGHDILLADDAGSFAAAVVRLLRDPDAAARIGEAAREKALTRYDNDALGRDLLSFYESLLQRG